MTGCEAGLEERVQAHAVPAGLTLLLARVASTPRDYVYGCCWQEYKWARLHHLAKACQLSHTNPQPKSHFPPIAHPPGKGRSRSCGGTVVSTTAWLQGADRQGSQLAQRSNQCSMLACDGGEEEQCRHGLPHRSRTQQARRQRPAMLTEAVQHSAAGAVAANVVHASNTARPLPTHTGCRYSQASLLCRLTMVPAPSSPLAALLTRRLLRYSMSTSATCGTHARHRGSSHHR